MKQIIVNVNGLSEEEKQRVNEALAKITGATKLPAVHTVAARWLFATESSFTTLPYLLTKPTHTPQEVLEMAGMATNRKVRKDFDLNKRYSVNVVGCSHSKKKQVQQAFFDIGRPWAHQGREYVFLEAAQYTNVTIWDQLCTFMMFSDNVKGCNMSAEEFLDLVYEPEQQGHPHSDLPVGYAEISKTDPEPCNHLINTGDIKMNVKLTTTVCFSDALRQMKLGYPIQRTGWNGKGLWVRLFNKNDPDKGVQTDMTADYAFITYPDGNTCPWVPSQSDMLAEDWVIGIGKDIHEDRVIGIGKDIPVAAEKKKCYLEDIIQHLNDGYRVRCNKGWGAGRYIQRHSFLLDKVVYAGSDDEEANLDDYVFEGDGWEIERCYAQSESKDIEFHEIAMYLNSGYIVRQKFVTSLSHLLYDENLKICEVKNHSVVGKGFRNISEINPDPSAYPRDFYRWEAFKKGEIKATKTFENGYSANPVTLSEALVLLVDGYEIRRSNWSPDFSVRFIDGEYFLFKNGVKDHVYHQFINHQFDRNWLYRKIK